MEISLCIYITVCSINNSYICYKHSIYDCIYITVCSINNKTRAIIDGLAARFTLQYARLITIFILFLICLCILFTLQYARLITCSFVNRCSLDCLFTLQYARLITLTHNYFLPFLFHLHYSMLD